MENRFSLFFLIAILSFITVSCGSSHTRISSSKPLSSAKTYRKIMVEARSRTHKENLSIEWKFQSILKNPLLDIIASHDFFPSDQPMDPEQRRKTLLDQGIEGVLVVEFKGNRTEPVYSSRTYEKRTIKQKDGTTKEIQIEVPPRFLYNREYRVFDWVLLDVEMSFKPAWTASTDTSTYEGNSDEEFFESMAKAAQKRLMKDQLISPPPKK